MILAVDIGNTNLVIGGIQDNTIQFESRIRTETTKTSDEYSFDIKMVLDIHGVKLDRIEGAIIASVVPQVLNSVKTAIAKLTGKTALVVGPGVKTGLNIKVENPAQTGADLVVGCVAAMREHKPPMIIVDMGTATTLMVLDKNGSFIGGSISPGVKISLDALSHGAALLPGLQIDKPRKAIGRNTVDCMRSGIMYGNAAMIDGMIARMEAELGYETTVIATGGIAKFVVPLCTREIIYERNLILKGLAYLYRENVRPVTGTPSEG